MASIINQSRYVVSLTAVTNANAIRESIRSEDRGEEFPAITARREPRASLEWFNVGVTTSAAAEHSR